MKTHQVIAGSNGERIVTSTTETLLIPASEIQPGDWLLKHHGRGMRRDKLITSKRVWNGLVYLGLELHYTKAIEAEKMVDVERTT